MTLEPSVRAAAQAQVTAKLRALFADHLAKAPDGRDANDEDVLEELQEVYWWGIVDVDWLPAALEALYVAAPTEQAEALQTALDAMLSASAQELGLPADVLAV